MFSPLFMGTDHMLGQDSYVPITINNFEVRVYDRNDVEFSQALTLATDSIGAVEENEGIIDVHYGNGFIRFPSKVVFNEVTWSLNCFCEPNILDELRKWRKQVYDPETEKMGLPSEYMKEVYFIKYDGQGNTRDIIYCPGTWIGALNNGEMNQEGGNVVKVTVPFIISRAIYNPDWAWKR